MKKYDTNQLALFILAFFLIIFVETFLFKNGSIFFVVIGLLLLYYGVRQRSKSTFYSGVFFLIIAVFNLWSLRLFILMIFIYLIVKLWQGTPTEEIVRPIRKYTKDTSNGIWKNKLFSIQTSPFSSYEWEDVHIQGLFGNIRIDMTETVLPKGTSLVSIRQVIGKVKIELPYEIPVRIHYTTLFGEAKIFNDEKIRLMNEFLHLQDGYDNKSDDMPEVIITIATWAGDLEVVRK